MATENRRPWWSKSTVERWWAEWDWDTLVSTGNICAPALVTVHALDWRGYDVTMKATPTPAGFICSGLNIERREARIDHDTLRAIPVTELLKATIESVSYCAPGEPVPILWKPGITQTFVAAQWFKDDAALKTLWAGGIYQLARFAGVGPTEAVQEFFGVSLKTAGRLVAKARQVDIIVDKDLPPTKEVTATVRERLKESPCAAGNPPDGSRTRDFSGTSAGREGPALEAIQEMMDRSRNRGARVD